ncbi:MAG: hypothetical protein LBH66_08515 [Oscillospiraceae bacterium]|jgi:hypothetical protein|nr:hypothetical protein [Oscillospiraceae bacterium]
MPRGRKKVKPEEVVIAPEPVVEEVIVEEEPESSVDARARKPYPSHEERINMAEDQIMHWEALNARRRSLVASTEKMLENRKNALAKGEAEIQRLQEWKQRLVEIKEGLPSTNRTHSRQKFNELLSALKTSGKSIDDVLDQLKTESHGA